MLLRTFTAADMPSAMKMVREALGDDAIILTSEPLKGKKGITITAAIERNDGDGTTVRNAANNVSTQQQTQIDDLRHSIQTVLRFHNIPDLFANKMARHTSDQELLAMLSLKEISGRGDDKQLLKLALEKLMANFYECSPIAFDHPNLRIMLIGTPGIGKTLTIAKMAAHLTLKHKNTQLRMVSTDTKRAGGIEQLKAFTDILDVKLEVIKTPKELQQYLQALPPSAPVLRCSKNGGTHFGTSQRRRQLGND
jgi:flagellar biosynthesis protein FlhF